MTSMGVTMSDNDKIYIYHVPCSEVPEKVKELKEAGVEILDYGCTSTGRGYVTVRQIIEH